jgi:hypothetical protein
MANKKISELQSRTPALSDLMLVGDPSSGYSYKATVTALATIIETDIADGFVTLSTTQTISGAKTFSNIITATSVANTPTDPDKFLTLNASNQLTYRTGTQVLSDIGGVGGSGTTNYLSKFSGSTTLGNSQIFDNGTNVGINTSTPDATSLVEVKKTDGYGVYVNYTTNTGSYPTAAGIYLINNTLTGGYAMIIEEKTPVFNGGQYPLLITHSLSSGTAASGMATGIHFGLPNDAGVIQRTQLSIDTTDAAASTYSTRYRFNLRYNNAQVVPVYMTGIGLGVFNSAPSYPLDVTGETRISTINNATTDTDKFLVSDSGVIKYRTGAEVLSDIGGQGALTLTTTGTSGAATLVGNTLNIPQYTDQYVGTVTSVAMTVPTGLTVSGTPITSSGTLAVSLQSGYSIPTTASQANWDSAYNDKINSAAVTGTTTKTLTLTQQDGGTVTASWSDLDSGTITGSGTTNYIPKFTSSSAIGNSQLFENGSKFTYDNSLGQIEFVNTTAANTLSSYTTGAASYNDFITRAATHQWLIGGSEQMRLTSTGLGIGTSSPAYKLDVSGTSNITSSAYFGGLVQMANNKEFQIKDASGNPANVLFMFTDNNVYLSSPVSGSSLIFRGVGYTERMRLDASGNLGLGVTPSAWSLGKAIEVGALGNSIWGAGGGDIALFSNAYYNSNFIYASSNYATGYRQQDGVHKWLISSSGTAGNAISFTQAMTLDASGRLGIGTSTPAEKLDVYDNSASNVSIKVGNTSGALQLLQGNGAAYLYTATNQPLIFSNNNSEKMRLDASGNLGIGTSSPTSKLQSNNASTYNSSTPSGAIVASNLSNGNAIIDIGVDATYLGYIQSRNLTNTTSYNLLLNPLAGNVGIGTTSPSNKLTVNGTNIGIDIQNSGTTYFRTELDGGNTTYLSTIGAYDMILRTNSTEKMRITSGGNVGIGTSSPTQALDVLGIINIGRNQNAFVTNFNINSGSTPISAFQINTDQPNLIAALVSRNSYALTFGTSDTERMRITSGGEVLVGSTSSGLSSSGRGVIEINGTSESILGLKVNNVVKTYLYQSGDNVEFNNTANGYLALKTNASERMRITNGGELLINTTTDAGDYKLQVNGNVYAAGTLGINTSGQTRTISTYYGANSDGQNIFIGGGGTSSVGASGETYKGAYNTSVGVNALYSNTTGYYNSAMGMYALYSNTTGYYNSAMGMQALFYNTTGYYNSAMGMQALYSNTTGHSNAAMGVNALYYNTTGHSNAAMGLDALFYNTTGYQNTGLGVSAGYSPTDNISNKRITTDYDMILIGYGATKNSASQLNNSIAIGIGTLVTASNTAMWGNSSMTNHIFQAGNLEVTAGSIKTAAPSGGTAKPWKLGEAGVTLGGSNTSGVRVEIDGTVYYLVTGYLP